MLYLITITAILSGIDNLQVCSAIGLLPITGRQRRLFALTFSLAEILAPWIGLALGNLLFTTVFQNVQRYAPLFLLGCGLVIVALALKKRDISQLLIRPGVIIGLPLSLGIDNLIAGFGLSSIHAPIVLSASINGLVGAGMSCAGIYLGSRLRPWLAGRVECLAGLYLCVLSLRMLFLD